MIDIRIETDPSLSGLDDSKSEAILTHTLQSERVKSCDISIVFGNKKLLQELKNRFFNINRTTDVIAFRINEYQEQNIEGEIYIGLPVAMENAEYFNEPYEKEIARLIIHGGLHLIGYEDGTDDESKNMRELEDKYLKELNY
ncbi:MAG: rRNA maturation RNase YbeY [Candidatus Marinimicrobia bacterium]|nr:rRNA maturation RNase YbeY [Candidatus Neomarinimicrobiota bacterium]